MFSQRLQQYAQDKYERRLPSLGALREEIETAMERCAGDEQLLMKFLYGTMPLRDAGEYGFDVFLGFVRHSLMVYRTMDWCRDIPEDMFLHYILYYRVNSENIEDCRGFFYEQLADRVKGMSAREAVLEINYWCAENGTYEASDNRTISPMTVYRSGKGRCGEESTFAVTAFRSVGIPARQVYTPRWAHCDDNHAWVEVYADGGWHFLGACEPEEVLDRGWFTNASSRALLVHTRTFSDYAGGESEECLGQEDLLVYYNETSRYGRTKLYEILVKDAKGQPVPGAEVSVEILNMAEYCNVASLFTDESGLVSITVGLGDFHVRAMKDGLAAEAWARANYTDRLELTLMSGAEAAQDCWADADVEAPEDYPMHPVKPTREQKETNRRRLKEANRRREERIAGYYDADRAANYPAEAEILRLAAGNFEEVYGFLSRDENPDRAALLHSLPVKDYKDLKAAVLERHLEEAAPFREGWTAAGQADVYRKYILCPRLFLEEMTDYRGFIRAYFPAKFQAEFQSDPRSVWSWIKEHIGYDPKLDYKTICSTPAGCLKLGQGNFMSRKLLFAAICRTFGIPARINPVDLEAEFYRDGAFFKVSGPEEEKPCGQESAVLKLVTGGDDGWSYYQTWTIARKQDNRFVTLDYTGIRPQGGFLRLELEPGVYRLITSSRLPSGNQQAGEYVFGLAGNEEREIALRLREGEPRDMLVSNLLDDFDLRDGEQTVSASSLTEGKANILAFLSEGQEPTEHVLNEMLEQKELLNRLDAQILFVLQTPEALENRTLKRVLEEVPAISTVYADFDETVEPLARRMYVDPDKLPLLLVTKPGLRAIYGCSGYNVGSVGLMVKLLDLAD